ncbi:hypothetical protein Tco_0542054 [Tanacetum coccineum]
MGERTIQHKRKIPLSGYEICSRMDGWGKTSGTSTGCLPPQIKVLSIPGGIDRSSAQNKSNLLSINRIIIQQRAVIRRWIDKHGFEVYSRDNIEYRIPENSHKILLRVCGVSEDPNQHLKDFLKLVDSLDLDGENRERTRLQDLSLYDNESWNDPRDFAKPVKAIALPQDVSSASDRRLIELENQVQRLMEAHLAPTQPVQVNKVSSSCKICSGPYDTQYCIKNPEQASVDYTSSRIKEVGGKRFTPNHGPINFNDTANTWKEKPNFNWAHTQTFTSLQGGSISVHSSSYQMKLEKALLDFDSNQEKKLSHRRTQLEQQQDDMIGKINLLWKTISEKLNNVSTPENARNLMASKSIATISHDEREELRKKGIKNPSKLLSLKYLSPASIKELNKNPSAPKRVHFINSIVILSTNSDTEEDDDSSTNACDLNLGSTVKRKEEVKEQGKEENEMETDMEVEEEIDEEGSEFETDEEVEEIIEEEEYDGDGEKFNSFPTMKELTHHEWLLKNPRPPWVKARIRAESPNNIKISCMVGHFFKRHAYIDLESPINIMSRRQYNQIMTYWLRSRQKPSNPIKLATL